MHRTIAQRISDQEAGLVGRRSERAILRRLLADDVPLVVFVYGIGGVGKSALVAACAAEARTLGVVAIHLDCGSIEPTERGFFAGLSSVIGGDLRTARDAAERLTGLRRRVLVILDRYEVLRTLDPWLRRTFVPALDENVRIILAGREPPVSAWPDTMGTLFRGLPLGSLPRADAEALLARDGVTGTDVGRIQRMARGHPLSLRLAASAIVARPGPDRETTTTNAIVEGLTERYLYGLDPSTRLALDAAAVVRRVTLSLLGAMQPETAPQDSFERLRSLPFVEMGGDGLIVHETIREVAAALLRSSDPVRSRRYRVAAWRQLRDEVARASPTEMWRYTADLLFILQNPVIREAFFPTTEHLYVVEAARHTDWPEIADVISRHEPPASAAILEVWWQRAPSAFRTVRDDSGVLAGMYLVCQVDRLTGAILDVDPVARRWQEHLRRDPVPSGRRVLLERLELARDPASAPAVVAAILLDLKRMYMELRPELRRVYSVDRDRVEPGSAFDRLGIQSVPGGAIDLDGVPYHPLVLDLGPASVDGWLTRIVAAELQVEDDSILDVAQHQLVLDGRRIDLTRLEFEVLHYLFQRPGRVVERSALMRDVWGHDDLRGSNALEVLVASLRRKLGDRATTIETVRGLGYRFVGSGG